MFFLILIYSFAIIKNSKCHQIFIISEFFASFVIDFIITIPINRVIVGIISQNDVMLFFRVGRVFKVYLYQIIARIYLIFTISWNRAMIFNACLGEKTWNFPKSSHHEKRIRFARTAGIIFSFKFKIYAERKFFTIFGDCAFESAQFSMEKTKFLVWRKYNSDASRSHSWNPCQQIISSNHNFLFLQKVKNFV